MSRRKSNGNLFLNYLEYYITTYMEHSRGLSPNTIISYKTTFKLLIEFMYTVKCIPASGIEFNNLNVETITAFLDWIENERKCSVLTRNQRLAALYAFSEYAQNKDFDAASGFRSSVVKVPMKKTQGKERAFFTTEEVKIFLDTPIPVGDTGKRDKVLLSIMYASGMRAQEICDLRVRDVKFLENKAILHILGKGRKARQVQIGKKPAEILKKYITYRRIEAKPEKHVFSSQTHEQMTVSCVEAIFKKYVSEARKDHPSLFMADSYPPHLMRHTTAVCMLEAGVPLPVIKSFLGHANLATTEIYASLSQETVNKEVQKWNESYWSHVKEDDALEEKKNTPYFLL